MTIVEEPPAEELSSGLAVLGYPPSHLRSRVPSTPMVLDVVAFSSPVVQDMSTTGVAGKRTQDGDAAISDALASARAIAAPAALISNGRHMQLFAVGTQPREDRVVDEFDVAEMSPRLLRFRHDLGPEVLGKAKQASYQLPLFPIDVRLLAQSRVAAAERISDRVSSAFTAAAADAGPEAAARAVVAALATLVVRDRYGLTGKGSRALARQAVAQHGDQFSWFPDLVRSAGTAIDVAIAELDIGTDFGTLDSTVVSRLYEELLVSPRVRRELGIHYTPLALAEKIVGALPFEELDPDGRTVLDPSCGSGTLLIAAHSRLAAIAPGLWTDELTHQALRATLHGWDVDPIAVEIARLSLVVHSLPFGNHWQVESRDAFAQSDRGVAQVVVSNPPWSVPKGKRKETAEGFLARMGELVSDGGYLACVLPGAWLTKPSSATSRRLLGEAFDIFEVWRLPRDVFRNARQSTSVVFAQKRLRGRPWLFRQVAPTRPRIEAFLSSGRVDFATVVSESSAGAQLSASPFDSLSHFSGLPRLGDVAKVVSGVVLKKRDEIQVGGGERVLPRGIEVLPLAALSSSAVLRVSSLSSAAVEHRDVSLLLHRKILVPAQRFPDSAWRCRPVLDEIGVVPNESWHAVVPDSDDAAARYALMALFASATVAAWFYFHSATKRLSVAGYRTMPLPTDDWEVLVRELAGFGRRIVAGERGEKLFEAVDEAVDRLYAIDARTKAIIRSFLAGQQAPEGRERYPVSIGVEHSPTESGPGRPGAVLGVMHDRVVVWTDDGPPDGTEVTLPDLMPGWLCTPGSTFEVIGTDLRLAEYRFHRSAYLTDEQLLGSVDR